MATQLAKLASTAHTAKPIAGRKIKTRVAKVGRTPWAKTKATRSVGVRSGGGRAIIS
jgi:hypothetical protein